MTAPFYRQYRLLLWKNFNLRRRRPVFLTLEILAPVLIVALLAIIRTRSLGKAEDVCLFQQKPLASMGTLAWLQALLCNFNNTCHNHDPPNDFDILGLSKITKNIYDLVDDSNNLNIVEFVDKLSTIGTDTQKLISENLNPTKNREGASDEENQMLYFIKVICGNRSDIHKTILSQLEENPTTETPNKATAGNSRKRRRRRKRSITKFDFEKQRLKTCDEFYETLNTGSFEFIFKLFSYLLRGIVYYTPDTPLTRAIMANANYTYNGLANLQKAAREWRVNLSPSIRGFLNNTNQDFLDCIKSNNSDLQIEVCKLLYNTLNSLTADNFNTADELFESIEVYLSCIELNKFRAVNESMIDFMLHDDLNLYAGVIFDGMPTDSNATIDDLGHIQVRIRMDPDRVESTNQNKVLDRTWKPGPRKSPFLDMDYFTYGFIFLQEMVGKGLVETITGKKLNVGIKMQQFPYPCYLEDVFVMAIGRSLPLFMVLGWIFTVSMTVRAIVYEKEKRLKEVMKVMGLSNGIHWLGWFTTSFILTTFSVLIILFLLKMAAVLPFTSVTVLFFSLMSFLVATITQCFFVSVLFSRANIAATVAGLLYFLLYLPFSVVEANENELTEGHLYGLSLFAQVAFSLACRYLARYEEKGIGAQWDNIWISPSNDDPFSLGKCLIMLWFDSLIHFIAAWYIEAVFPGQYGVPRVWYFPFTKSYWCGPPTHISGESNVIQTETDSNTFSEAEPANLPVGVIIKNLKKVYKNSKTPAVDGLNLNFFEGQITSFLGHNGAGKTTTMSILTGLYPPTSGTAVIYGHDITQDMDAIRENVGLCPQHNVLFDDLTVQEHIYFYGLLKGMKPSAIAAEINHFIEAVGLPNKRHDLSKSLSGGMKRKLSVAMAFVGGSRLVILDEPTAGVDPHARRSIWELLGSCRKGRTILLTTHHMDEADVLGDRIAIIAQGKLRCVGSSIYLKNVLGNGYKLILAKSESSAICENSEEISQKILDFINEYVPGANLEEETISEYFFKLPLTGLENGSFAILLRELDSVMDKFYIKSYGLADTSLEEVFLRVADDPDDDFNSVKNRKRPSLISLTNPISEEGFQNITDKGTRPRPVTTNSFRSKQRKRPIKGGIDTDATASPSGYKLEDVDIRELPKVCNGAGSYSVTGGRFLIVQFIAMWIKRFHNLQRNKKGFVAEIIVPPLFILLAVGITSFVSQPQENPPMELHPWLMAPKRDPKNLHVFYSNKNPSFSITNQLTEIVRSPLGVGGVRCMNSSLYSIPDYPCYPELGKNRTVWSASPKDKIPNITPDCDCSQVAQVCHNPLSGGPAPSSALMPTTDYLYNLSGYNITDYLLKTHDQFLRKRYGGFVFQSRRKDSKTMTSREAVRKFGDVLPNNSIVTYLLNFIESLVQPTETVEVWFENKGYASSVAYVSILHNLLLRQNMSENKRPNFGISFVSHPLNLTYENLLEKAQLSLGISILLAVCVIFALAFIPASFLLFLIDERISGAKHLQIVSGLNPYLYWIANYMWDIVNYIVPCVVCIFIFLIFDSQAYISRLTAPAFILLMIMYGLAVTPIMYMASFVFKTPSAAFVVVSSVNLLFGLITTLTVYIVGLLEGNDEKLKSINNLLKKIFLVFPQYCLGKGLLDLSDMHIKYDIFGTEKENPLQLDIIGTNLVCMLLQTLVFFSFVLIIEHGCGCCPKRKCCKSTKYSKRNKQLQEDDDDDVIAEKHRVLSGGADKDAVKIDQLTKEYSKSKLGRPAVDNLCLGVRRGECFGLLGVNGAGKTTTFKMLTGHYYPTSGEALVEGDSVTTGYTRSRNRKLGYCPQFDALNSLLTGRETLYLYARLRRIPSNELKMVVDWALNKLRLDTHADKQCGTYSGGNKRKLSTAVALIGNPSVILLDEPTSGMDAGARRYLWNCINSVVKEGRSIILTTHSMEECEALCQRLTVMVNGKLKCLGSVQHLKTKFGDGYTLDIKLNNDNPYREEVEEYMNNYLPECSLKECNYTLLQYKVPSSMPLSIVLDKLTDLKMLVDRYSVSQTSLDQVFIDFAKHQSSGSSDETVEFESSSPQKSDSKLERNSGDEQSNPSLSRTSGLSMSMRKKYFESLLSLPDSKTLEDTQPTSSSSGFGSENAIFSRSESMKSSVFGTSSTGSSEKEMTHVIITKL